MKIASECGNEWRQGKGNVTAKWVKEVKGKPGSGGTCLNASTQEVDGGGSL